jgi:two-component system sensor histidine kinase QseC
MSPRWSLRRRLVALLTLAAALAWGVSAVWLAHQARAESERMFDASLIETAHVVLALAAHELQEGKDEDGKALELSQAGHDHAEQIFYQVRSPRGEIALYSAGAPAAPLADVAERGLADHVIDGAPWRVYTAANVESGFVIHMGEPAARREALERTALVRMALPGMLLVLLLATGAWWVTGRVLQPIERTARRVDALAPGEGCALAEGELPREVEPLGRAIERLQARVQQALLFERTLTADAAHELRTPLAAVRAQAQWAARAPGDDERRRALADTVAAADRAARFAESVLTLARLDAASFDATAAQAVALEDIAEIVRRDCAPAAAARGVTLELSVPALALRADPDALAVLLRNLVENAVRHARSCVRVEARCNGEILIAVRDDGEGVPAELRTRLFDRFYRAPGSEAGGSGLGLALVKRLAELHGGSAAAGEGMEGAGLGIEVRLPRSLAAEVRTGAPALVARCAQLPDRP